MRDRRRRALGLLHVDSSIVFRRLSFADGEPSATPAGLELRPKENDRRVKCEDWGMAAVLGGGWGPR